MCDLLAWQFILGPKKYKTAKAGSLDGDGRSNSMGVSQIIRDWMELGNCLIAKLRISRNSILTLGHTIN